MLRAAQYLRMSTEHQQYSLENQSIVIERRALEKGYLVVKTYADAAKSGVTIRNRKGLKQLLEDVVGGNPGFDIILVYDVSRWGRFQDADEAAHYEFLCRSAGVPIEYCAETFSSEPSIANSLMKALKRSMAAEYSRELSEKVRNGQARLAQLGFRQGGMPGYGLRRLLIPSEQTRQPRLLAPGERIGLTDRVVLVPGPPEEVEIVREIFSMFVREKKSMQAIASRLNERRIPFTTGVPWHKLHVARILTGEKYVGTHVFGKRQFYLGGPPQRVPISSWVVVPEAFKPLVSQREFELAGKRIARFTHNKTDEQVLLELKKLLRKSGRLSREIIEGSSEVVSVSTIEKRFGGLLEMYKRIGFDSRTKYYNSELLAQLKEIRHTVQSTLSSEFPSQFTLHHRGGNWAPRLKFLPVDMDVSVAVARHVRTVTRRSRWSVSPNQHEKGLITVLVRLKPGNKQIYDFYVFGAFFAARTVLLKPQDQRLKGAARAKSIAELPNLIIRLTRFAEQGQCCLIEPK